LGGFVQAARRTWPEAEILVTTNGFFLHRHPDLPRILAAATPATLRLSRHHNGSDYMTGYLEIEALVSGWERDFGIRVQRSPATEQWTRRYHGHGEALRPYAEGDAGASFANCSIKNGCHQLLDFRLYKCAPLAYLPLVARRYALDPVWAPYLAYEPLAPGCSEAELRRWLACGTIPECAMCPTRYEVIPPSAQPCPLGAPDRRLGSRLA
jgi:hypothetical protein